MAEINTLVFDLSWTLLFPRDRNYTGKLNALNEKLGTSTAYNPLDHFRLNRELLDKLVNLKDGYNLYVFTAGSMHNLPAIKQELGNVFIKAFSTRDIGYPKTDPAAFQKLATRIDSSVEDIVFVDDSRTNVEAARRAGCQAIRFENNQQLLQDLQKLGLNL